jgi:hypothetical protein
MLYSLNIQIETVEDDELVIDITISGPNFRFTPENCKHLIEKVKESGDAFTGCKWNTGNGECSITVKGNRVRWSVSKAGDGEGGRIDVYTPYNKSFVDIIGQLAKL